VFAPDLTFTPETYYGENDPRYNPDVAKKLLKKYPDDQELMMLAQRKSDEDEHWCPPSKHV
jgi:hypothetical protein